VITKVGLTKKKDETADVILKLYDLFLTKDALLIEVNPYAESISTGGCKFNIFKQFFFIYKHVNLFLKIIVWMPNSDLMTMQSIGKKNCLICVIGLKKMKKK